ncbi:MAG: PAS domain S-box protein [Verrucomicrobiota bacterium]
MNSHPLPSDPAFPVMALDLISHLLGRADNPGELARYLADELRDLTGARGILLTQCGAALDGAEDRMLCLEPTQFRLRAEAGPDLPALIRTAHQLKTPAIWRAGDEVPAAGTLAALGFALALVFPLRVGEIQVGSLVVFGLPDPERLNEVRDLLQTLAGIVALVLRNAALYQDQEWIIEERTRELREVAQFNRQIIRSAQEGIIVYGPDLRYQVWNPYMEQISGLAAQAVLGKHPADLFPFLKEHGVIERLEKTLAGELPDTIEFPYHLPSIGKSGWASDACAPLRNAQGEIIGVIATVRDITGRKQVEEALREAEARQRKMVANIGDVIVIIDQNGINRYKSPNLEKWFGWRPEEVVGAKALDNVHPDDLAHAQQFIGALVEKPNVPATTECRYRCKDGSYKWIEFTGVNLLHDPDIRGILGNYHDIMERKRLERERVNLEVHLRQQQKLESIGTLASGVAHEINNPINGVMNYAQLILDRSGSDSQAREYAKEIIHETERVAVIVRSLLQFARQEKQAHSPARMQDMIEQTLSLIRTVIRRDQITLQVEVPPDLPAIKCRSQQIQQVLMNLLTNARDALNQRYSAHHADKIMRLGAVYFERDGRRWVRITVEDHGAGIPAEVQGRIFDPFFTTKSRSEGTGLGLSISHSIVKDHHGKLWFETEVGRGTKFHLELPVN